MSELKNLRRRDSSFEDLGCRVTYESGNGQIARVFGSCRRERWSFIVWNVAWHFEAFGMKATAEKFKPFGSDLTNFPKKGWAISVTAEDPAHRFTAYRAVERVMDELENSDES